jgi:RND family efflux transporter MFP subunit
MSRPSTRIVNVGQGKFGLWSRLLALFIIVAVCAPRARAHGEVAGGGAQNFVETIKGKQGRYRIEVMYSPSLPTAGEIANVEIKVLRLLDVPDPLLGSEIPVGIPPEGALLDSKTGQPAEAHLPVHPEGEPGVFGIAEYRFSKAGSFKIHLNFKSETGDEFAYEFPITIQSNPASFFRWMVNLSLILLIVGLTAVQVWRARQKATAEGGESAPIMRPVGIGLVCLVVIVGVMDRFILPAVLNVRKPAVEAPEHAPYVTQNEDGTYTISETAQKDLGLALAEAKQMVLDQVIRATGQVEARPDLKAIVQAPLWGRIEFAQKPLAVGEPVKRGQQLAVVTLELSAVERGPLEAKDLDIKGVVAKARERRDAAQLEYDRMQKLAASNPLYEPDAKWAKELRDEAARIFDEYRKQDDAIETTKKFRDPRKTPILCPINGVISSIDFTPGELNLTDEYKQLFTVVDTSRVFVRVQVYGSDLMAVKKGQQVSLIHPAAPNRPITGVVHWIGDSIDPVNRSVPVLVDAVNEGGLLALNSFLRTEFHRQQRVLAVPEAAVVDNGTSRWLYIAQAGGKFAAQPVEVGIRSKGFWQIVSGVSEGDQVVVNGAGMLGALPRTEAQAASYSGSAATH